jgi:hypothetical protein
MLILWSKLLLKCMKTHQGILYIVAVIHLVKIRDQIEHSVEGRRFFFIYVHVVDLRVPGEQLRGRCGLPLCYSGKSFARRY